MTTSSATEKAQLEHHIRRLREMPWETRARVCRGIKFVPVRGENGNRFANLENVHLLLILSPDPDRISPRRLTKFTGWDFAQIKTILTWACRNPDPVKTPGAQPYFLQLSTNLFALSQAYDEELNLIPTSTPEIQQVMTMEAT